jgi:hypothetical protein
VRYARNPAVLWRSTSLGPVVLIPGRELPTRLSGLAAVVWEVLDDPLAAAELDGEVAQLLDESMDLSGCLAELLEADLVVPSTP